MKISIRTGVNRVKAKARTFAGGVNSSLDSVVEGAGVISVFYGVHRIYEPAAFIVVGIFGVWLAESKGE